MTSKAYFIPNFKSRSVLLMGALTVGMALAAHGQTAEPGAARAPSHLSTQSVQNTPVRSSPNNQGIEAAFIRADTNKDGKLSRQETARFPAVEQRFEQIDTNRDDFVSREEFEKALQP